MHNFSRPWNPKWEGTASPKLSHPLSASQRDTTAPPWTVCRTAAQPGDLQHPPAQDATDTRPPHFKAETRLTHGEQHFPATPQRLEKPRSQSASTSTQGGNRALQLQA